MAVALTTIDNPFDPFENFDEWFHYDIRNDHYSCALLDRIAQTSDKLTDEENEELIEQAIDEFLALDVTGMYKKVYSKT